MTSRGINTWQACLSKHLQQLAMTAAISFWVAQIIGNSMGTMLALCLLCHPLACLPAAVFLLLQVSSSRHLLAVPCNALTTQQHVRGGPGMQVAIVVLPVGEAPVLIQRSAHNLYSTHPLGCWWHQHCVLSKQNVQSTNHLSISQWHFCRAIHFSVQSALSYFSCRVTVEDADALKPGQAYVVGTVLILLYNESILHTAQIVG